MERDYDFDSRIHYGDLEAPETIGRRAGERTVRRLDPKMPKTGTTRSSSIRASPAG